MKRILFFCVSYFCLVFSLGPTRAFAQAEAKACTASGNAQNSTCKEATAKAVAAEKQMSADGASQSGEQINKDSSIAQTAITAQQEYIAGATKTCDEARQACEKKCDDLATIADKYTPPAGASVRAAKKKDCTDPINQDEADLKANAAPLAGDKKDASNTGQNSGMQMPQIPSPSAASPSSAADSGSSPAAATQVASATPTTPTLTTASGVGGFSTPTTGSTTTKSSSDYKTASLNPSATTASSLTGGSGSGGGGSGSSGGGSSSGAAGAAGGIMPASVGGNNSTSAREGASTGIGSLAVDGGGGGGGSTGGGSGGSEGLDPSEISRLAKQYGLNPASASRAPATIAGSTEVVTSYSQGLFSIGDAAINTFCTKKYLQKNCAK